MKSVYKIILLVLVLLTAGCASSDIVTERLKNSNGIELKVKVEAHLKNRELPLPSVLIAHGSDGVRQFHRDWAKIINSWGYNAVIVDHYSLRGIGMHTGNFLHGVRGEDRAREMLDSANWTMIQPWHKGKIGIIGFSQGGGGILALVNQRIMENLSYINDNKKNPFSAAVGFYPACLLSQPPSTPSIPTQLHLAEKDDLARLSYCHQMSDPGYDVIIHKDATHAFDVYIPSGARLSYTHRYSSEAIQLSQKLTKEFLDKHIRQ